MKPWFIREDNVIPFPKKDTSVVRLPNINAYPDFLTGVQDLQNHLKQGDISSDIHKKLYQDLIHRFMKVESFETPWFLREAPGDPGITGLGVSQQSPVIPNQGGLSSLPQAQQIKIDIQKMIKNLNPSKPEDLDLLSRLYTTLNKTDYSKRVLSIFGKDTDNNEKTVQTIGRAFLEIEGSIPEKNEFLQQYEKGFDFIDAGALLSNPGTLKSTQSIFKGKIAQKLGVSLIGVQGSGYATGNVGPGEIALASLSRNIKITTSGQSGGDLLIGQTPVEVKSNEGRMYDKGNIDYNLIMQYLQKTAPDLIKTSLTAEAAAELDTETKTTGEKKGWPEEDETQFWQGFFNVVMRSRYPDVKISATALSERIGYGRQFLTAWLQIQFSQYRSTAGHQGILLIGNKTFVYATEGSHLANNINNFGYIYYPNSKEARESAIQFKIA